MADIIDPNRPLLLEDEIEMSEVVTVFTFSRTTAAVPNLKDLTIEYIINRDPAFNPRQRVQPIHAEEINEHFGLHDDESDIGIMTSNLIHERVSALYLKDDACWQRILSKMSVGRSDDTENSRITSISFQDIHGLGHYLHSNIFKERSLEKLSFNANISAVPSAINLLEKLRILNLSHNAIETFPMAIMTLHQLEELCFYDNKSLKKAPKDYKCLQKLVKYDLRKTGVPLSERLAIKMSNKHIKDMGLISEKAS